MATLANKLVRILQGNIFHVTSITGYKGIVKDQFIRPDREPEGQGWNGQCKTLGGISLVDLRGQNRRTLNPTWCTSTWKDPLSFRRPCIILMLNVPEVSKLIVPVPKGTAGWLQTHCEKCTSSCVPLNLVERIIIFKGFNRRFKVLERRLFDSEIKDLMRYRNQINKDSE